MYVPGCVAYTDPPLSLIQLIWQRWRWTNGAYFASLYFLKKLPCWIGKTKHPFCVKFGYLLHHLITLTYQTAGIVLVGTFYTTFSIFIRTVTKYKSDCLNTFQYANLLENIYIGLLCFTMITSLGQNI